MCIGMPRGLVQGTLTYKRNGKAWAGSPAGCANLPKGGSTQVTAKVDPPGGRLQFSADPATKLGIQSSGLSATVTGASPGRATLKAEYSLNGKTAIATLPGSSIELTSVNNGVALPKLGLLGLNG